MLIVLEAFNLFLKTLVCTKILVFVLLKKMVNLLLELYLYFMLVLGFFLLLSILLSTIIFPFTFFSMIFNLFIFYTLKKIHPLNSFQHTIHLYFFVLFTKKGQIVLLGSYFWTFFPLYILVFFKTVRQ